MANPRRLRLDAELVRRGLARSRDQAVALIINDQVKVAGLPAKKPATAVTVADDIVVSSGEVDPGFVSRGAHKLAGALAAFAPNGFDVAGKICLDAGASTGGFTDVLLRENAAQVIAVDVGYGQLAWSLQSDPRVQVIDRQNVRELTPAIITTPVQIVVADLSFISLTKVLPALISVTDPTGDMALMVKPQFEVGKNQLGKGGVVRKPELRASAVIGVASFADSLGWGVQQVATSPLPGPSGNIEYFLWLANRPGGIAVTEIQDFILADMRAE